MDDKYALSGIHATTISHLIKCMCHPKVKVASVVCFLYDNLHRNSDYEKLNDTKVISETLVMCSEHRHN